MPTYLITGGAGFIGSNLVRQLVEKGERVRVLDNFTTGSRSNLTGLLFPEALVEGDVRDLDAVRAVVAGADYVVHLAAQISVPLSIEDPVIIPDGGGGAPIGLARYDESVNDLLGMHCECLLCLVGRCPQQWKHS